MESHGYSSALRSHYVRAGWLENPTRRVYRRPGPALTWQQGVISLQSVLGYALTVGGRTALDQQGFARFLSSRTTQMHLYGSRRPPTWLANLPVSETFIWHNSLRLFQVDADESLSHAPTEMSARDRTLQVEYSSPERAVLEMLDELPHHESFQHVDALMEGMSSLSPRRMQGLLEA